MKHKHPHQSEHALALKWGQRYLEADPQTKKQMRYERSEKEILRILKTINTSAAHDAIEAGIEHCRGTPHRNIRSVFHNSKV